MCLKLYCDCFANGEFCLDCNCKDCHNNLEHEAERSRAIKSSLERNPAAFKPKIGTENSLHGNDEKPLKVLRQNPLEKLWIWRDFTSADVIVRDQTA
jgi:hypothetical protein